MAYVVSLGVEQVAVPDLTDQPEADALTALDDAGLVAGDRSEAYDDTIAAGNVLSTDPAAGSEVAPGSAVAYVVSLGVEQVAVPDLTDQPEADALTALDDAGLVAGDRSEAYDDTIAAGNVLSTDACRRQRGRPRQRRGLRRLAGRGAGGRARPHRPARGRCPHRPRRRRPGGR